MKVPNVWNLGDDSPASMIGGVGWYRKDFSLPEASRALEWAVRFESVNYRSRVWLNGKRVGSNRGAYIPFELRLSGLRRRGTNRLVIRVDSKRRTTDFPPSGLATNGTPTGGWWNYSGLQREVYLKRLNVVDWKSVRVTPLLALRALHRDRAGPRHPAQRAPGRPERPRHGHLRLASDRPRHPRHPGQRGDVVQHQLQDRAPARVVAGDAQPLQRQPEGERGRAQPSARTGCARASARSASPATGT